MLRDYGRYKCYDPFRPGIDFRRQNLTSKVDPRAVRDQHSEIIIKHFPVCLQMFPIYIELLTDMRTAVIAIPWCVFQYLHNLHLRSWINPYYAEIDFRRQNLTFKVDPHTVEDQHSEIIIKHVSRLFMNVSHLYKVDDWHANNGYSYSLMCFSV